MRDDEVLETLKDTGNPFSVVAARIDKSFTLRIPPKMIISRGFSRELNRRAISPEHTFDDSFKFLQ
jgi:hypothetical protein